MTKVGQHHRKNNDHDIEPWLPSLTIWKRQALLDSPTSLEA
jgi:hypothetical protein